MAISRQGDVIKVPFPYTDRPTRQSRPALVVSSGGIEDAHGLLWVVMITSAENRRRARNTQEMMVRARTSRFPDRRRRDFFVSM